MISIKFKILLFVVGVILPIINCSIFFEKYFENTVNHSKDSVDGFNTNVTEESNVYFNLKSRSLGVEKSKLTEATNSTEGSWESIETILNSTTTSTPYPPFNKTSIGACINSTTDVEIIFGKHKSAFQNIIAKCSRKSLGSYKNTMKCLSKVEFEGKILSQECSSCWAKTAHCGVKHCAHQCLFSTCVAKCQKCSIRECSKSLNECAGTLWMPLPCGLDPHSPIPENFKVQDPK